jgi:hypothetical protein
VTPGTMTAGSTFNESASIQACTILPGTMADPLAGKTYSASAPVSAAYTIVAAPVAPTILLAAGTYGVAQQVSITDATPGASIFYTINGGPAQLYNGPITIAATEVLEAGAFFALTNGQYVTSPTVTDDYTIVAAPTFSLAAGPYTTPQQLMMTDTTPGVTIFYLINGGPAIQYKGPITVSASESIQAAAVLFAGSSYTASTPTVAAYTIAP